MADPAVAQAAEDLHGALKGSYRATVNATLVATAMLTGFWLGLTAFGWVIDAVAGVDSGFALLLLGLVLAPFVIYGAVRIVRPSRVAGWVVAGIVSFALSVLAYVSIVFVLFFVILGER